ncbi:MAG: UDP-N-acetylmuramoyl-tripeptide--D-alanyl-D-alanine ligase [Candidatus Zixiibacteriota bacterium]
MIKLNFSSLAKIVDGRLLTDSYAGVSFNGVSIDSRTSAQNELFVAIEGANNDGHQYIDKAIEKNVAGLLLSNKYAQLEQISKRIPIVAVNDTHLSLKRLAQDYARKVNAKYMAITGSNGKTTTKEFVYGIIHSLDQNTYRSPGNLNNEYGLPLAIFKMPSDCQFGIFEYGISHPGEMTSLTEILTPDLALITNVGPTHLETLGTIENVAEAKLELADAMAVNKPVLINADDPILIQAAGRRSRRFITYGVTSRADFRAEKIGTDEFGNQLIKIDGETVQLPIFGDYQIYNLLAGYAVAKTIGLNPDSNQLSEIKYDFAPHRGQIENHDGLTIIADCYNANPVSMASGLKSFKQYVAGRRDFTGRAVVVIGDMLELGKNSTEHHRQIGELLASLNFDLAVVVGKESSKIFKAALGSGLDKNKISHFENTGIAAEAIIENIKRGDIIYFKASRGIALEKIITLIKGSAFRQN